MIWDTDLLDPEMATFLSEAQPWTQGFARQQMAQHLARDWDWHKEGTVPDPAWNLNEWKPPQINPQAPAKVTSFTYAEMREWKERRLRLPDERTKSIASLGPVDSALAVERLVASVGQSETNRGVNEQEVQTRYAESTTAAVLELTSPAGLASHAPLTMLRANC